MASCGQPDAQVNPPRETHHVQGRPLNAMAGHKAMMLGGEAAEEAGAAEGLVVSRVMPNFWAVTDREGQPETGQ
jgi:hypothetical protein